MVRDLAGEEQERAVEAPRGRALVSLWTVAGWEVCWIRAYMVPRRHTCSSKDRDTSQDILWAACLVTAHAEGAVQPRFVHPLVHVSDPPEGRGREGAAFRVISWQGPV